MRDLLTILAGALIAVLVAMLAVPPLIDWPTHRALVDRAIARAVGQEVRTEGALDIRLLPSPRIRMTRLRLGSPAPDQASLDAMFVRAEIALTPLLAGEVRFLDTRIGRAEIKLPTGAGGDWRVPRRLTGDATLRRAWVFEDLAVQQLLVTTVDPTTGRTDQGYAETVRVQAGSLAGPWRLEGVAGAVPFEIALGEIGPDLSASLKVGAGGGARPRLDIDGRLDFVAGEGDMLVPRVAGTAKLATLPAPAGGSAAARASPRPSDPPRLPVQATAALRASGRAIDLADVALELGAGATSLRLTGSGRYRVDQPRLSLALAGRRFDLAGFAAAQWTALRTLGGREGGPAIPVDLALKLDSLGVGADEDLTGLALEASADEERLRIGAIDVSGPGRSRLVGDAEVTLGPTPAGSGRIRLEARDSDRLGRLLDGLGLPEAHAILDGRPVEASADITVADPVVSLRNLRVVQGGTSLSGTLRHTAAEPGRRARIDAQLAIAGLDVASLPNGGALSSLAREVDLGITLDARGVGYGTARGGRISGRIVQEGASILVEGLEVRDIAGAEANLSGRISPDGTGRIEGRLTAPRAAPLIDLFGRAWIGGAIRLLPEVARREPVDLTLTADRVSSPGDPAATFRTAVRGRFAGGTFEASTLASGGVLREIAAQAATDRSELWLGPTAGGLGPGTGPGSRRPGRLSLSGRRDEAGRLVLEGEGDVGGVAARVSRPVVLGGDDDRPDGGEVELRSADASAWLPLLGPVMPGPIPLTLRAGLTRTDEGPRLALSGRVSGSDLSADVTVGPAGEIGGTARLGRLSLPWLASTFALGPVPEAPAGSVWSTARFARHDPPAFAGSMRIEAGTLDLGGGRVGRDATFTLATRPDGLRIQDASLTLGEGRLRGAFTLDRQGGLASLIGEAAFEGGRLSEVLGPPFGPGRLALALRFGSSGESLAGLVGTLGGAGEIVLDGFRVEGADPAAPERIAARVLGSDDPLATQRWLPLLAQELDRGALAADRIATSGSLVGGALRLGPIRIEQDGGSWLGAATVDLRSLTLEARGTLQAKAAPRGWTGAPPAFSLGWIGPLGRPVRTQDPAPLINGLAGAVLARELDRIETFELDAAERGRLNARTEVDRQRRLALEEARQARLREEAAERAREADRIREAAERAREAERQRQEAERRRRETERAPSQPLEIRPPVQAGERRPE